MSEHADGLICISRTTAAEVANWLKEHGGARARPLRIDWFHLGADIESSAPTDGLPQEAEDLLAALSRTVSFLMVGTLEPRKGHAQVLAAFEQLWASGTSATLVIVGKQGWMVEALVEQLREHPERGQRLFWLEGVSDEYLEKIYRGSTCLIAASEGEGFGLPLIEAARHKVPILARDVPVFREVAGEHASYFKGDDPDGLALAIKDWLKLYAQGRHPKSDGMPWLTWAQSVERLKAILLGRGSWQGASADGEQSQTPPRNEPQLTAYA